MAGLVPLCRLVKWKFFLSIEIVDWPTCSSHRFKKLTLINPNKAGLFEIVVFLWAGQFDQFDHISKRTNLMSI